MSDEKKRTGSFHELDELVKLFPHEPSRKSDRTDGSHKPRVHQSDIHDRLFESAWRAARERVQRNDFSNQ